MSVLFQKLVSLARRLRSKNGCPWDKKQTIAGLEKLLHKEALEIHKAVQKRDYKNLREEIGDTLFVLVMMANIAREKGYFTMNQVLQDITQKIIRRHTWVFGNDKAKTPEEALRMWKRNKKRERI